LKRLLRPTAVGGALAVVAAGALTALAPANAAVLGAATLSAASGNADTLISVSASGPCQEPATKVKVRVDGFGLPDTGLSAYSPQTIGFSTENAITNLQLTNSFKVYATNRSTALVGAYSVKVQCVNNLGTVVYDEYETTMYWTTPGNDLANIAQATYVTAEPTISGAPAVTGAASAGSTLSCATGTWSGATSITRAWLRNGTAIPGATGATYVTAAADIGTSVSCRVTATNAAGSAVADSNAVVVAVGAFTSVGAPVIGGTVKVGQRVTATPGTWTPTPSAYAYQWLRSGAPIAGATTNAYVLQPADRGRALSVRVTASGNGATTAARTSAARTVLAGTFAKGKKPTVKGKAKVGKKLKAIRGSFSPAPTYTLQWQRNGKDIKGATKVTYKLKKKDAGKTIRIKVIAAKPGYVTATATSKAKKVKARR
jgi:hypothetical protein